MTAEGNGVGHTDGMAVFVSAAAVGDVIRCRIVKVQKNLLYGIIESIIKPSPHRADRGCGVKKTCGGCLFRHVSYEAELMYKQNIVKNAFVRIGKFPEVELPLMPILGCVETERYRNKAQYPVSADNNYMDGKMICGFYAPRSHRIVPCGDCLLQPEVFGRITAYITDNAGKYGITPYNEETGEGLLRHIYIRRGHHSGQIMVCFVSAKEDIKRFSSLAGELMERFPDIRSAVLNINPKKTNVIMGDKCVTLGGSDTIEDIMCGNRIVLSPLSFYQVNTAQAELLYGEALEFAELEGNEDVLDLYCGAGTISLSMAAFAGHITGAEIIPAAVENAKRNAEINGIDNVDFICADAGQAARMLSEQGRRPRVIITDPPRKGCDELTLESIVKMAPERVVMISCNPATAARDCRYLADKGYELRRLRAADMFPGTGHVECVAQLINKA